MWKNPMVVGAHSPGWNTRAPTGNPRGLKVPYWTVGTMPTQSWQVALIPGFQGSSGPRKIPLSCFTPTTITRTLSYYYLGIVTCTSKQILAVTNFYFMNFLFLKKVTQNFVKLQLHEFFYWLMKRQKNLHISFKIPLVISWNCTNHIISWITLCFIRISMTVTGLCLNITWKNGKFRQKNREIK